MTVSHASLTESGTPAEPPQHIFERAAAWLREQAAEEATGSRDFGRGYMHAANLLADATSTGPMSITTRCGIARSLLERPPSEHVCRLVLAVMQGASLADLVAMEVAA